MRIKNIIKKRDLYEIIFEDNANILKVKVTEDFIIKNKFIKPRILNEEEVLKLKDLIDIEKYYIKCINRIKYKVRSIKEIKDYLIKEKCNNELIDLVLNRLINNKYLDDKKFAKLFFNHCIWMKKGPNYILNEMKTNNINNEYYNIDDYSEQDISDNLTYLIDKEILKYKSGSVKMLINKITKKMIIKGYYYEDVKNIFKDNIVESLLDEGSKLNKDYDRLKKKYSIKFTGYELKQKISSSLITKGYDYNKIKEYVS